MPRDVSLSDSRCNFLQSGLRVFTRREIFSKSYQIKPKSNCNHRFLIDLELNGVILVPNQSVHGKYNPILV